MYGLKGLKIERFRNNIYVVSPSVRTTWDENKIKADRAPARDNTHGIWVTYSLPEAMKYSKHIFVVEGWGTVIKHTNGFRSEYARITAHVHAHPEDVEILDDLVALGIPTIMPSQIYEFLDPIGITSPDPENNEIVVPLNMHVPSLDTSNAKARILGSVGTIYTRDDAEHVQVDMRNAEIQHIHIPTDKHARIRGNGTVGRIDVGARSRVIIRGTREIIRIAEMDIHPHAQLTAKNVDIHSASREHTTDDDGIIRYECQIGKEQEYFFLPVKICDGQILSIGGWIIGPAGSEMPISVHKSILPAAMYSRTILVVRAAASKTLMPREYRAKGPIFPFAIVSLDDERDSIRDAAKALGIPFMDVERALDIVQSPDVIRDDGIIVDRKGMMACISHIATVDKVTVEWDAMAIYKDMLEVHIPDGQSCNIRLEGCNVYELEVEPDADITLAGSGYVYKLICTYEDAVSAFKSVQITKREVKDVRPESN